MNKFIFFILLSILSCCTTSKYNKSIINIGELSDINETIVIFGDQSYINFINIINPSESILIEKIGNSKTKQNIVKIKPGRYVLGAGLFTRTLRSCLIDSWSFFLMIPVPLAILAMPMPSGQFIEPIINNDVSAVFYFDIKPGEVIYIGNIDYKSTNCNIVLDNYFEDIVGDIKKDHPEISAHLKEKILKIAKKPDACNFLIEDINNLNNKSYKTCLDQLKLLP